MGDMFVQGCRLISADYNLVTQKRKPYIKSSIAEKHWWTKKLRSTKTLHYAD
jgi:hypothetical protein